MPSRASHANDEVVFGARLTSSVIVSGPQLVVRLTRQVAPASSRVVGAGSRSPPRALGGPTRLHVTGRGLGLGAVAAPAPVLTVAVRPVAVVLPLPSLSAPHPAAPARVIITARASARGRDTAAKDNPAAVPLSPLLRRYDHALLDLDGCVWVGDEPTARAVEAVTALRRAGKGIAFVTHDSRVSSEDLVRKLWGQGFQASLEEVVTVGGALQHLLAERADRLRSAFVIGSEAIAAHVDGAGLRVTNGTEFATRPDVVVVGLDERLHYAPPRTAVPAPSP